MTTNYQRVAHFISRFPEKDFSVEKIREALTPNLDNRSPLIRTNTLVTEKAIEERWNRMATDDSAQSVLYDLQAQENKEIYRHNIENYIGTVKIPVGVAGPVRINGLFARGDYYIPLATTEAALIASYDRGAKLISEAGGLSTLLLMEGINRAPSFVFENLTEIPSFLSWGLQNIDAFIKVAESTTRYGKLVDARISVEGNHVYINFEFTTGNAAGQNMVTIATEAVCQYIMENAPVKPKHYFVETNMSGDKKANALSFTSVRGKKVTAEIVINSDLIKRYLNTTPKLMVKHWQMCAIGSMLIGSYGVQGHYANGLAALFIATGQDVACVAEAAVGLTRLELTDDDSLRASVTLPNLTVGTVGGGTNLPSQRAGMQILGISGDDEHSALAFAEICAATVMAGELSIIGALSCGEFSKAHERLARQKSKGIKT